MYQPKSYRKFLAASMSTAVVVASALSIVPNEAAAETGFSDVEIDKYYTEAIQEMAGAGFVKGVSSTRFGTDENLKRRDAAVLFARVLLWDQSRAGKTDFSDVPGSSYYHDAIAEAVKLGLIKGKNATSFAPNDNLTRGEMAVLLARAFNLEAAPNTSTPFTDIKGHPYEKEITAVYNAGLTTGATSTTFDPAGTVTRAQFATFLHRGDTVQDHIEVKSYTSVEDVHIIESVTDSEITFNGVSYRIADEVKGLLNKENEKALKGSYLSFASENNVITDVKYVALANSGTVDGADAKINGHVAVLADDVTLKSTNITGNLVLGKQVEESFTADKLEAKGTTTLTGTDGKVSSAETSNNKPILTFTNSTLGALAVDRANSALSLDEETATSGINVNANNVSISSENEISQITVGAEVRTIEVNGQVAEMTVSGDNDTTVTGDTSITTLKNDGNGNLNVNIDGEVTNLEITNTDKKVTIGEKTKVKTLVLPEDTKAEDVIENYDDIKDSIENVDTKPTTPETKPPVIGGGGGGGGGSSSGGSGGGSSGGGTETPPEQTETTVKNESELRDAVVAAEHDIIKLNNDIELTEPLHISKKIEIDGEGHKISFVESDSEPEGTGDPAENGDAEGGESNESTNDGNDEESFVDNPDGTPDVSANENGDEDEDEIKNNSFITIFSNDVKISNVTIDAGKSGGKWEGLYAVQVYKAENVTFTDTTFRGADGGLLVNGAKVIIDGITTDRNLFGGIEVSQGKNTGEPKLTVKGINKHIEVGENPAIWIDGKTTNNDKWVVFEGQSINLYYDEEESEKKQYWFHSTTAVVSTLDEFQEALDNDDIKEITLNNDIENINETINVNREVTFNGNEKILSFSDTVNDEENGKRNGILVRSGGTGTVIKDVTVEMSEHEGWQGVYGIQVYNTKDVTLQDVTLKNGDGGLLVNGSDVTIKDITTEGNEFGGIEVSRKNEQLDKSKLTVQGDNTHKDNVNANIWVIDGEGEVNFENGGYNSARDGRKDKTEFTNYWKDGENPFPFAMELEVSGPEIVQDGDSKNITLTFKVTKDEEKDLKYLEIDHNLGKHGSLPSDIDKLPELKLRPSEKDPWYNPEKQDENDRKENNKNKGLTASYDAESKTWQLTFGGEILNEIKALAQEHTDNKFKLYSLVEDVEDNISGSMYNGTYVTTVIDFSKVDPD